MKKKTNSKAEKELQLVNYEQAVKLSKLGFDWNTDANFMCLGKHDFTQMEKPVLVTGRDYYQDEERGMRSFLDDRAQKKKKSIFGCEPCPTIQLAFKFLRTKGFDIEIMKSGSEYVFEVLYNGIGITRNSPRGTYDKVEIWALDTALEYIPPVVVPTAPAMEINLKEILGRQ